jgi:uncharacterized repeat protein (TIGR02543 family)
VSTTFVSKVITISTDLLPASGTNQTITAYWITTGMTVNLNYMFETIDGKNAPGAVLYNGKYYMRDDTYSQSVYSTGTPFALKEIKGMVALTTNALKKTTTGFAVPTEKTFADQYLFYDRASFRISFDSQGGTTVPDITGLHAGVSLAASKPSDPARTGGGSTWIFDGWYTSADYMTRFDFTSATMPDSNLMLYAKWTQDPYTVSVYDGLANSNLLGTYTRASGEYVGDPEASLAAVGVSVDYTIGTTYPGKGEFEGWVIPLGPGEKTLLSAELPVTGPLSVYADWKPQTFTVTYDRGVATGDPPVDNNSYQRGAEARLLDPVVDGSLTPPANTTFTGWLDSNGRIRYPGETITVTGNTVLTASYTELDKFVVYTYHINYPTDAKDSEGNDITDPGNIKQYVGQGQEFSVLGYEAYSPTPEPVGYRFKGWAESDALATSGTVFYTGNEETTAPADNDLRIDVALWAVWEQYFPVTFDAGGVYGNLDSNSGGGASVTYQVPKGIKLEDEPDDGGLGFTATPGVVTSSADYHFIGWALEDDWPDVTTNSNILGTSVTGPVTYKAVYAAETGPLSAKSFGVTFDAGGEYGNLTTGEVSVTYGVPENSTLLGSAGLGVLPTVSTTGSYTFDGWKVKDDDTNTIVTTDILVAPVTAPVTYEAVYSGSGPGIVVLDVVFDAGGYYGKLPSGVASVTYGVISGGNVSAVPKVTTTSDDYEFLGWTLDDPWPDDGALPAFSDDSAITGTPVTKPLIYKAVYAVLPNPTVGPTYLGVTFDAGGIYGNLTAGGSTITYSVPEGENLATGAGLQGVPTFTPFSGYERIGWALGDDIKWDQSDILNAAVTEPVTYNAVYSGQSSVLKKYFYTVIFDAGEYGTIASDGINSDDPEVTSIAVSVEKDTALEDLTGFSLPAAIPDATYASNLTFIGWSPAVDLTSPVTGVRVYNAQYAYVPDGAAGLKLHTVRFEIGDQGSYKNDIPITSYMVEDGESLSDLSGIVTFDGTKFDSDNITAAPGFEFIGWSPGVDPYMPVYADIVYRAQYAYVTPGLPVITYTPLVVTEDPPDDEDLQVLGYDGYYDGAAHGVRYDWSEHTVLSGVLSFWLSPTGAAGAGVWKEGLPPDETNVISETVELVFTADGKLPKEGEPIVERSIIIRPRPLVPTATHASLMVGDDVPFRATYDLTIGYDGKKQDGTLIGDAFDFSARRSEFANNGVQLSTTYQQGDPEGDYPIYARAGVYGNYEIYEGTEGAWPFFEGWRFAGVLHVDKQGDGQDNDNDNDNDNNNDKDKTPQDKNGAPETGDSVNPFVWIALLLVSLAALSTAVMVYVRKSRKSAKARTERRE